MEPTLLDTNDAARIVGVAPKTIRRWAKEGRLAYVELPSGRRRYRLSDLVAIDSTAAA